MPVWVQGNRTASPRTAFVGVGVQGHVQPLVGGGSSEQPQLHSRPGAPPQHLPARAQSQGGKWQPKP